MTTPLPPRPQRPTRGLTLDEGRGLYSTMADLAHEVRLLRGAVSELCALLRDWQPLAPMRPPQPSAHDIAVEVAHEVGDTVHRGLPSERIQAAVRQVARNKVADLATWIAALVCTTIVGALVAHFLHL